MKTKFNFKKVLGYVTGLLLLFSMIAFNPTTVVAASPATEFTVNIVKNGQTTLVHTYSMAEMKALQTADPVYYTSIDSMPAPVGTKAKGVLLSKLVNNAKQYNSAVGTPSAIKLYCTDTGSTSPYNTLSYDYLYGSQRYYFPNLVSTWDSANQKPGSGANSNPTAVEPMFAVTSYQGRNLTKAQLDGYTMDGINSYRFCFGQTADDIAKNTTTTNKFAKWVNRIDIVLPNGPTLTADTTNNTVGQAVTLGYTDNLAWRAAITGITVDGTALTTGQYTVTAGKIKIAAGVLNTAGNHTIVVQATGYTDDSVTQVITAPVTGIVLKSISSSEIDLSWNKLSGAKSYTIYRAASKAGTYTKIGSVKTLSFKNTKLLPSTSYWYKVTGTTAEGESSFSEIKTAATKALVPSSLKVSKVTSTSITLTWKEAVGSAFNVYRSTAKKGTYTKIKQGLSTASYTDPDKTSGTVYWYKVTASNPTGDESAASSIVSAATKLLGPSNLKAKAISKSEIDLSWNKITAAKSYIIYRAKSADGSYIKIGTSKTTDFKNKSGLQAKIMYWYKVTAVAATGEGEASEVVKATTLSAAK